MAVVQRGDVVTVRGWFARLGEPAIRAHPRLALAHAWALIMVGDMAPITARVDMAEQALARFPNAPDDLRGEIAALRGYIALYQGALPRSIVLLRQALATLPEDRTAFAGAAFALGDAYYTMGNLAAAAEAFTRAVGVSRAHGNAVVANVALGGLSNTLALQGRLRAAAATAAEGLALAGMEGTQQVTTAANLHANLGMLHYEWNEIETAMQHLLSAQEIGKLGEYRMLLISVAETLAQTHQARGDAQAARAAVAEAEGLVRGANDPWRAVLAAAHRVRLDLGAVGCAAPTALAAAIRWAESSGLNPDDPLSPRSEWAHFMLARVLLHTAERRAEGLRLLARLLAAAETGGRIQRVVGILALRAAGLAVQGDEAAALDALARALNLAAPEGYVRTFVDEGAPMTRLLREAHTRGIMPDYAAKLLAAAARVEAPHSQPVSGSRPEDSARQVLDEPLTGREREVLQLLVHGLSGPEIASRLIVGVSTVKTHLKSIYGKLGVHSRDQAIAQAKVRKLL
jgi:LuxR family maltose regulon positive regulatory protein